MQLSKDIIIMRKTYEKHLQNIEEMFKKFLGANLKWNPKRLKDTALGQHATVFQAEVFAIWSCGLELLSNPLIGQNINICSDSRAAIQALSAEKVSSQLVLECKTILETLSLENNIHLIWVPGHSDVPGNKEADQLARLGAHRS